MALSEQEVFILSERALSKVIDQIQDRQWDQTTPDWFQTGRQGKPTLRDIINYHAYDSAWVPDVLAGKTMAEVGSTNDGDLLVTIRKEATAATASRLLRLPSN